MTPYGFVSASVALMAFSFYPLILWFRQNEPKKEIGYVGVAKRRPPRFEFQTATHSHGHSQ